MNARLSTSVLVIAAVAAGVAGYRSFHASGSGDVRGAPARGAEVAGRSVPGGGARAVVLAPGASSGSGEPGAFPGPAPGVGAPSAVEAQAAPPRAGEEPDGQLASQMAKLARDLEFTPGLTEPPQQIPRPQPEPWRADPEREGPPPEVQSITPASGRAGAGQRVEIRGRNLRVVQVMFGALPADLLAASGNVVVVAAPAAPPGPATVTVTNDDGTWSAAPQPYVYVE